MDLIIIIGLLVAKIFDNYYCFDQLDLDYYNDVFYSYYSVQYWLLLLSSCYYLYECDTIIDLLAIW